MSESKGVSLLIPPQSPLRSQDLQTQIQQIVSQKGQFRHVTKQSLRAESQNKATLNEAIQTRHEEERDADEDDTPQKRQERLWKRRDEMLERLGYVFSDVNRVVSLTSPSQLRSE